MVPVHRGNPLVDVCGWLRVSIDSSHTCVIMYEWWCSVFPRVLLSHCIMVEEMEVSSKISQPCVDEKIQQCFVTPVRLVFDWAVGKVTCNGDVGGKTGSNTRLLQDGNDIYGNSPFRDAMGGMGGLSAMEQGAEVACLCVSLFAIQSFRCALH
jgi:hypothetical protein